MKKIIILILVLTVIFGILINMFYLNDYFNHEYDCIRYTIGSDEYEIVKVTFKGTIKRLLNHDKKMIHYQLTIGDDFYPVVDDNILIAPHRDDMTWYTDGKIMFKPVDHMEEILHNSNEHYNMVLGYSYWDVKEKTSGYYYPGSLITDFNFNNIVVVLLNGESYPKDGSYKGLEVIVSAESLLNANDIIKNMLNWELDSY